MAIAAPIAATVVSAPVVPSVVSTGNKDTDDKIQILQTQLAAQFQRIDELETEYKGELSTYTQQIESWKEKYNKSQLHIEEVERSLNESKEELSQLEIKYLFQTEQIEHFQEEAKKLEEEKNSRRGRQEEYEGVFHNLFSKLMFQKIK